MFLAHVPAGYIISHICKKKFSKDVSYNKLLIASLLGSIAPDLDLIYFYTISERTQPHHAYFSHIPLFWLAVFILLFAPNIIRFSKERLILSTLFIINVFGHLILDTVVGGIMWLSPLSSIYNRLFIIESRFDWWVLNYIISWTFLIELGIILVGLVLYVRNRERA